MIPPLGGRSQGLAGSLPHLFEKFRLSPSLLSKIEFYGFIILYKYYNIIQIL
jgi:hypothetical protein